MARPELPRWSVGARLDNFISGNRLNSNRVLWQLLVMALGMGGVLASAAPGAQTLCRSPADQERAKALYEQARAQQPGTEATVALLRDSISACPVVQNQYLLAQTLLQLGRYAEAEVAAKDMIALAKTDTEYPLKGAVLLAEALRGQGRIGEAKALYEVEFDRLKAQNQAPPTWLIQSYTEFENAVTAQGPVSAAQIVSTLNPLASGKRTGAVPRIGLRIEFEYDQATLTPQGQAQLKEVATAMLNPTIRDCQFKVIGHTDQQGADDYNQKLSERRAQAVVAALTRLQKELAPRLPTAEGRGEKEPRVLNATTKEQGAVNRRVEFEVMNASACGSKP